MKVLYGCIFIIFLAVLLFFWSAEDDIEKMDGNLPQPALSFPDSDPITSDGINQKPVLILEPIPNSVFSDEQCLYVDGEYNEAFVNLTYLEKTEAVKAFNRGEPKYSVADAIWLSTAPYQALDWYATISVFEALEEHQESLQLDKQTVQQINEFKSKIQSGQFAKFEVERTKLFPQINLVQINRTIFTKAPLDSIIAEIDAEFASIPPDILINRHLSPIRGLISSTVEEGHLDVAIGLMRRYPMLVEQENKYDARFISMLLSNLASFVDGESNKSQLSQLIQVIQNANTEPVLTRELGFFVSNPFEVLSELEKVGIRFKYRALTSVKPLDTSVKLNSNRKKLDEVLEKYEQCKLQENWVKTRTFTTSEWKAFESSDFIKKVIDSTEFRRCEMHKNLDDFDGKVNSVRQAMSDINLLLGERDTTLYDIDLSELPLGELTEDENAYIVGKLAEWFVDEGKLSNEEIKQRIDNAGLSPSPTSVSGMHEFLSLRSAFLWKDELTFNNSEHNHRYLNQLALQGNLNVFKALIERLDVDNTELLDPLYYFILGYSNFRDSGTLSFTYSVDKNEDFIRYLLENNYTFEAHHQRLLFEFSINQKSKYKDIIERFPNYQVANEDEYFGVSCN